jgi:hypothetical protein
VAAQFAAVVPGITAMQPETIRQQRVAGQVHPMQEAHIPVQVMAQLPMAAEQLMAVAAADTGRHWPMQPTVGQRGGEAKQLRRFAFGLSHCSFYAARGVFDELINTL